MAQSPSRLRVTDELGAAKTLAPGHEIVSRAESPDWLVLGLGPAPQALAATLPPGARVRYLECPAFLAQTDAAWRAAIPAGWTPLASFDPALAAHANILLYRQAGTLFPRFWSPVRAALLLPVVPDAPRRGEIALLPRDTGGLVAPGLTAGFEAEGFSVRVVDRAGLLDTLERERPALFFSVNFTGLDRHGEVQALLARAGVPVVVWCVDNPFHCLSGVKTTAWRDVVLCVTDDWFVEPLKRHGARAVHHLPLAADPAFFRATPDRPELAGKLLFVGRSAFPDKALFFSGLRLDPALWDEAMALLSRGERPDFGWWEKRLGVASLWPGRDARRVGYGAEESGQAWRRLVIREAARTGKLAVCGDAAWRKLVEAPFAWLPPVPYREALPGLYASARAVVGAVSPLLPHGLTQRHFDVWAAGGCLLTDHTPGLDIFPSELTKPIAYRTARDIPDLAKRLSHDAEDLKTAWRELIATRHTYRHRIRSVLEWVAGEGGRGNRGETFL
ncbi:conserved hypothetical protein [Solidesulfovibrio fructosivorans JJ]]|uniref:Spore protein YkvP/CgeB glycosyl transferase-like domain-containing protein n=1 Tax=Solidesulfovibrio fructosivorans JJ] TaxID=596151 RepID=E1JS07_SOLFR|nr:DUF3880 domain-containing protein [Solidesulfovibrio fructosivorans]EFL52776.1 conserved hypothetical protein [Solidesulfovibrio fructosivorans JJ]]